MFSTSLVAAAAAGLVASNSSVLLPAWQTDYRAALAQSAEQKKPVAVFIAAGGDGPSKLVANGGIGADAARLLRDGYVCLHVDPATAPGKDLAGAFGMSHGLVISNAGGAVQALRHQGAVPQADLTGYLTRYTGVAAVARTEERAVTAPVAVTIPAAVAPATVPVRMTMTTADTPVPAAAPVMAAPAAYAPPMMSYPSFGYGSMGGCAGGSCGGGGGFMPMFRGGCSGGRCR